MAGGIPASWAFLTLHLISMVRRIYHLLQLHKYGRDTQVYLFQFPVMNAGEEGSHAV